MGARELRLEPREGPDWWQVLLCPVCGGSWTHVDAVEVHSASGAGVTVRASGEDESATVSTVPTAPAPDWPNHRRHAFTLVGRCEDGCTFRIALLQHKGQTFALVDGDWR